MSAKTLMWTCRVRLLSLAAQRFIATALNDAMQIQAKRQKQPSAQLKDAGHDIKDKRPTLTIEDLAQALQEVSLAIMPPSYQLCSITNILTFRAFASSLYFSCTHGPKHSHV